MSTARARHLWTKAFCVLSWCAVTTTTAGPAAAQPPDAAPAERPAPTPAAPSVGEPEDEAPRPPPLHVEYAQYGVAMVTEISVESGATCPDGAETPCIIGSGGGLVIRGGYRSPGPWYLGGAYEFVKMDSANLYRLGIFQQIRGEMRYHPDLGYRTAPYGTWGVGAVAYGNEWGVDTAGALVFGGGGVDFEVSRFAIIGLGFVYRPTLIAGWTDTTGQVRNTGVAHFLGLEFQLELRTELGRE